MKKNYFINREKLFWKKFTLKWWKGLEEINRNMSTQFKDTDKEKAPSNKTPALSKSMNMNIWVVGTLNQLFVRIS